MFKAYEEKNDSPFVRTFLYIGLLNFCIFGTGIVFVEKILIRLNIIDNFYFKKTPLFWMISIFIILVFNYILFFRSDLHKNEELFNNRVYLNKFVKLWMLIPLPFLILFLSLCCYVFMFGGVLFGKEINGFF